MSNLLEKLNHKNLRIYGTGFVAELFFQALRQHGMEAQIECFLVSCAGAEKTFHGYPVFEWDERSDDRALLCLAVHDAVLPTLPEAARSTGIAIYSELHEMLFGQPVGKRTIGTEKLLRMQDPDDRWLAIRMLGLEAQVEKDQGKASLYLSGMKLHCSASTAERRLEKLEKLYGSVKANGLKNPIEIDEKGRIIDGLHRVAIAVFLGIREIPCLVFHASECFNDIFPDKNRLPEGYLKNLFTTEEMTAVNEAQRRLFGPLVSVILPVYNVAAYIDSCMETVVHQTWRKLEIILINDGSDDGSYERCLYWEKADRRVRVLSQTNQGVSAARNRGIEEAGGEYLGFVDPDDWIAPDYFEKLASVADKRKSDFVECDLWRYNNRNGEMIYRSCYGQMEVPYSREEHMIYGPTACYKSISKKSIWLENGLRFPSCAYESPAVYALILALSKRVDNVREPLYFYRRFRENSLIERYAQERQGCAPGTEALSALLEGFRKRGLYHEYANVLPRIVIYRLNDILAMQYHRKTESDFKAMVDDFREYLEREFPEKRQIRYITWGGYNLNRIMCHVGMLHDPRCRFNFSSLASLSGDPIHTIKPRHRNRYREMMLEKEWGQTFWKILDKQKPEVLFLDLIEERFDLLKAGNRYLTQSDAFTGAEAPVPSGERVLRSDPTSFEIWKESCAGVFDRIRREAPELRFVIVENYLCERVGDIREQTCYSNLSEIQQVNCRLHESYAFVKTLLPEADVVSPAEDGLYFTDRHYEYGAVPSHVNELENRKIAREIETLLERRCHGH